MLGTLPDIQFLHTDIEQIIEEMVETYETNFYQETGVAKRLYPGDPVRISIYTFALRELQLREAYNQGFKQTLLAYARDEYLDHWAARYGTERKEGSKALVSVKFTLSAPRSALIPKGTRLLWNDIYFETLEDYYIEYGQLELTLTVAAQIPSEAGNDVKAGEELTIVDPIPFIISAVATEPSIGGADRENDEEFRERLYDMPETLSVAGPREAYEALAKQYSNAISDVRARRTEPGTVAITVLMDGGEQPNEAFLNGLESYLSEDKRRPLTDYVIVQPAGVVEYNLDVTYFLTKNQIGQASSLSAGIENAVQSFILGQKSKLGRDVNPSDLIYRTREAGAKRIVVRSPEFQLVDETEVAVCQNVNIVFGGFEDE